MHPTVNSSAEAIPVQIPGAPHVVAQMTTGQVKKFTASDALDRAWRTFKTGVGIDIAIAVVIVLAPAFTNIEWTKTYWLVLASQLGKSVLQAIVSYYYRKLKTPKVGVQVK